MNELREKTGLKIGDFIYKKHLGETDNTKWYVIIEFLEKKKEYSLQKIYPETFETKLLTSDHMHWHWDYIVKLEDEQDNIEEYVIYSCQPNFTEWSRTHFEFIEKDDLGKEEIRMMAVYKGWFR